MQARVRRRMTSAKQILKEEVDKISLVDGHAHNLIPIDADLPFIRCFTEAEGEACKDVPHSLSFKRSIHDIANLYGCDASIEKIEECRNSLGLHAVCSKCFSASNIAAILIDDGLRFETMHDIDWHKKYVSLVGRVVRIEAIAEDILNEGLLVGTKWTLESFSKHFQSALRSLGKVSVAFKSIAAYRSGLDINPLVTSEQAEEGLYKELSGYDVPVRISNKDFIDYIVTFSLDIAVSLDLPIQIHTGFGDKELDLRLSNPLHLRSVLEDTRFKKCRIVLLHASHPYSKEASYLACVYPQIYLDFGLAIPKLSIHGMQSAVKDLLELCPLNKVMFSTDGYAFPETFYLGAKWSRDVIVTVLSDACDAGDLSIGEAVESAQKLLRNTATTFYKLDELCKANPRLDTGTAVNTPRMIAIEVTKEKLNLVRLIWVDGSGQQRCRVVPEMRFNKLVKDHGVGLTHTSMGMSSFVDGPANGSGLTAVGEIRIVPDMGTLHVIPWRNEEKMVLVDMHSKPGQPWEYCPRSCLRRVAQKLYEDFGLVVKAGFEMEFFILKPSSRESGWTNFDLTPYSSTQSFDAASPFLTEIVKALESIDIFVEQLHAEAGGGQFEIVIQYSTCINAADNLVFAKETVKSIARKNGFLATFLPKYDLMDCGSGCHVHLSIWQNGINKLMAENETDSRYGMSTMGEEFMAGVLHHLPSILAFTAPLPNSYERLKPNTWSGAYRVWGKDNKEAPIRTTATPGIAENSVSNFEVKSFDGCANPHLGLAALIAAGIDGLQRHFNLPEPINVNPSDLKEGTVEMLPRSLEESTNALEKNECLKSLLGKKLVDAIIAIRKAEVKHYSTNKENIERLIQRY